MVLPLLLSMALAAPPEGVDWEEASEWEARWPSVLTSPPGCWEVVGRATWNWDGGRFGGSRGNAAFVAMLDDGRWKDIHIQSLGEVMNQKGEAEIRWYPHGEIRFVPLIGRLNLDAVADSDIVGQNFLDAIVSEIGGDVMTFWSDWSEERDGVVLKREMDVNGGARASMEVLFPGGGSQPTRLDVSIPDSFPLPDAPLVRIRDAEAHVRSRLVAGLSFPEAESMSFTASIFGYRAWGAQTIRYETFRPCGGEATAISQPLQ